MKNDKEPAMNSRYCDCRGGMDRRDFLKAAGAGSICLLASRMPVMAGPFTREDFDKLVPVDKKLDPAWVKSLFERGAPQVYKGENLKYIGMPIGGICSGQLYIGGDGRLYHWDIFNEWQVTNDGRYANPAPPDSPVEQSFILTVDGLKRGLDREGFREVTFRGAYPIGAVEYRDAAVPVEVRLEAFSPFIPLNTDDSSLPATILRFTVRNREERKVELELTGVLENAVCQGRRDRPGMRMIKRVAGESFTFLECAAGKVDPAKDARSEIVFEDWNKDTYQGWTVEGNAFGNGPIKKFDLPGYMGDVGGDTERVVSSHATAPGKDPVERDNATGKLTSSKFKIVRNFIRLWIGGGDHPGSTCVNLLVDGKVARTVTGRRDCRMFLSMIDVRDLEGKEACLEIVDAAQGDWGNIGVGGITFADDAGNAGWDGKLSDHGTMGLALLGKPADHCSDGLTAPLEAKLVGSIGRRFSLEAGASTTVDFVLTWHFPNLVIRTDRGGIRDGGRYYATKFKSALEVAGYVVKNFKRLTEETRLWHDTWYDSTLPYWLLDRTQLNTSTLATSTCYRLDSGRFWGWEGVGCCEGTCGHVWHYAHAVARLFPELERILRERVDFGFAQDPDGAIRFRAENNGSPAIDAQAGAILRTLREHQMSVDSAFLQHVWPGVKRATDWLIAKDGDGDGLIEGNQHNTLDADWYGPVAWLSGLYLAALQAAAAMADEMDDAAYAEKCRAILSRGQKELVAKLFDGGYFINKVDPKHLDVINSGTGCEIDQVFGQSWAFQVGLPRVLPKTETVSALKSLWRYNFAPDVGTYRKEYKMGRWLAMAGEAGLLMCTFPRKDWDFEQARAKGLDGCAGLFNECMNGFEYQVAWHMIWEGMVLEGLAIARAVHDRYHPSKRNPWNEVECGDHYARSMASYGVYLAACGFENHGPKGHIGFAPRLMPDDFRCAFTAPEGWGTFSQKIVDGKMSALLTVKWGQLRLRTIDLGNPAAPVSVTVKAGDRRIPAILNCHDGKSTVILSDAVTLEADQSLELTLSDR